MARANDKAQRRKNRVRRAVRRSANGRPRLSVFRSSQHIYAQVIDDTAGNTVAAASSLEGELRKSLSSGGNKGAAEAVGKLIAKRALDAGVNQVVFDRGGHIYHGRVKALAEAAREAGLSF